MSQRQQSSILTRHAYTRPFREASEAERLIHHRHRRREFGLHEPHVISVPRAWPSDQRSRTPLHGGLTQSMDTFFSQINTRLRQSSSPIIHLEFPSQCFIPLENTAQDFILSNHISERQCSNPHMAMQTRNL